MATTKQPETRTVETIIKNQPVMVDVLCYDYPKDTKQTFYLIKKFVPAWKIKRNDAGDIIYREDKPNRPVKEEYEQAIPVWSDELMTPVYSAIPPGFVFDVSDTEYPICAPVKES